MVLRKLPAILIAPVAATLILSAVGPARSAGVSAATEECLGCHEEVTPGFVGDWKASRHAKVTPAAGLIGKEEQAKREGRMRKICQSCHSRQWVEGHYEKFARTIETTNAMTLAATKVMLRAWDKGLAGGLAQGDSIFNEALERTWVSQWLFYANSIRYASAMGGADYGVFANGRCRLSANLREMLDHARFLESARGK